MYSKCFSSHIMLTYFLRVSLCLETVQTNISPVVQLLYTQTTSNTVSGYQITTKYSWNFKYSNYKDVYEKCSTNSLIRV